MADRTEDLLKKILEAQGVTNTRLTKIETKISEREKICGMHATQLTQHDIRIGKLEVDVGTLKGSWKTYLTIGGISAAVASVITWIGNRGGG